MRKLLVVFAFALIAGCTAIGQQKAVSPEDNLRYGQAVLTGLYTTLGNAAEQKSLPAADARSYYNRLADPKAALDAADGLCRGTVGCALPTDVISRVNLAVSALTVIAGELRARLPATQTAALPALR